MDSYYGETIGVVERLRDGLLILRCTTKYTTPLTKKELHRWAPFLRNGSLVAVLKLDDGSVQIRILDKKESSSV